MACAFYVPATQSVVYDIHECTVLLRFQGRGVATIEATEAVASGNNGNLTKMKSA